MSTDFKNLCRLCLKEDEALIPIFDDSSSYSFKVSLSNKIRLCCQIVILPTDNLPQQLCPKCHLELNIAYELREVSQSSETTLKKYLSMSEDEVKKLNQLSRSKIDKPSVNNTAPQPQTPIKEEAIDIKPEGDGRNEKSEGKSKRKSSYKCDVCDRTFDYKCHLKEHEVSHSGDRSFLCQVCGKAFSYQPVLKNHLKIHFDKNYKCDLCSLSFRRKAHLITHRRTHTGEKPFYCSYCSRRFAQKSYLKVHMRLHSGEKPFVCETCGHSFARKSGLVMHSRTHTGELPFPCPECNQSFSQRSQRKRHLLKNHKDSPLIRVNGDLLLREHDQLRAMLGKITEPEDNIAQVNSLY